MSGWASEKNVPDCLCPKIAGFCVCIYIYIFICIRILLDIGKKSTHTCKHTCTQHSDRPYILSSPWRTVASGVRRGAILQCATFHGVDFVGSLDVGKAKVCMHVCSFGEEGRTVR